MFDFGESPAWCPRSCSVDSWPNFWTISSASYTSHEDLLPGAVGQDRTKRTMIKGNQSSNRGTGAVSSRTFVDFENVIMILVHRTKSRPGESWSRRERFRPGTRSFVFFKVGKRCRSRRRDPPSLKSWKTSLCKSVVATALWSTFLPACFFSRGASAKGDERSQNLSIRDIYCVEKTPLLWCFPRGDVVASSSTNLHVSPKRWCPDGFAFLIAGTRSSRPCKNSTGTNVSRERIRARELEARDARGEKETRNSWQETRSVQRTTWWN